MNIILEFVSVLSQFYDGELSNVLPSYVRNLETCDWQYLLRCAKVRKYDNLRNEKVCKMCFQAVEAGTGQRRARPTVFSNVP